MNWKAIDRFLNSDWAFGLTQTGARRRRDVVILLGAFLWASAAYLLTPLPWDTATAQKFLLYPVLALFNLAVFPIIFVLAGFFGIVLFLAPRYLPHVRPRLFRQLGYASAALFGILWAFLAYQFRSPDWDVNVSARLISYPFEALFAARIFRHVLVAIMAFWISFRVAAVYLQDIFNLDSLSISERYILQAAFGSGYNTISIKDGAVAPEQKDSPVIRIGGPGWVRVYLENAAIFEKNDGRSRVIGPTSDQQRTGARLAAFERLRAVIDLRDRMDDLSLEARTSDGIRVKAEDVHIVFSVFRNGKPSSLEQPYPYDPDAIKRLFYSQESPDVEVAMGGMIRRELAQFISRHSLSEFLAAAAPSELVSFQATETGPTQPVPAGGEAVSTGGGAVSPELLEFVTRPQIITDLFAEQFAEKARERGVELKWIGVGTWATPNEIVPQRHRDAWRLSLENLVRGSEPELARVRRENETLEFLRQVQETAVLTFRKHTDLSPVERMLKIVIAYHSRLNEVYQNLLRENRLPEERARLREVLVFLSRFTTHGL